MKYFKRILIFFLLIGILTLDGHKADPIASAYLKNIYGDKTIAYVDGSIRFTAMLDGKPVIKGKLITPPDESLIYTENDIRLVVPEKISSQQDILTVTLINMSDKVIIYNLTHYILQKKIQNTWYGLTLSGTWEMSLHMLETHQTKEVDCLLYREPAFLKYPNYFHVDAGKYRILWAIDVMDIGSCFVYAEFLIE